MHQRFRQRKHCWAGIELLGLGLNLYYIFISSTKLFINNFMYFQKNCFLELEKTGTTEIKVDCRRRYE
jgi:hypothetical protein